ncbi:hypothetical protein PHJA_000902900 [Phtheirospermum japonicum]|uniref:Uncharacterized protein n=1 Tax=Phtheirospermum japonicum TaxID=374723 RepID=A0A830BN90_9LAMI|nr:hypothetical protein PHJA_000902900 [Phtheirospermum japonicum]
MEHFHDPAKRIAFLNYTKDTLWKLIPDSVKDFPWKKAESVALHRFLILGKETLKWSLLACFTNKELVIPFGLFVGSLMTKYFDEISQDLMHEHKYGHVTWRLLAVSCFYVLVKLMSTCFRGGSDFLLHAANGGLMQAAWNWKDLPEQDGEKCLSEDVSSIPMNAEY